MERVTGIGGFFFRSHDPDALGRWYAEHLGVQLSPPNYDDPDWWQELDLRDRSLPVRGRECLLRRRHLGKVQVLNM